MKNSFSLGFLAITTLLLTSCRFPWSGPAVNPDPNHTHADFAVWVENRRVDFTDERYMSHAPTEGEVSSADDHAEEEVTGSGAELRKYLHLHDGNGDVLHRHKPGLTFGEFLASLGFTLTNDCLSMPTGNEVCNDDDERWQLFVNGAERSVDPAYVFDDLDAILLTFGATEEEIQAQLDTLTDDACLYSRTCPERGDPPTENCIADPEVPCVVPEE